MIKSTSVIKITFLSDEAVHFLRKTGKDLLGSICQRHSFIISMLVERVESTLDSVREVCFFCCSNLASLFFYFVMVACFLSVKINVKTVVWSIDSIQSL